MTQDSPGLFSLPQQILLPGILNLSRRQLLGFTGKPSQVRAPGEIKRGAEGENKTYEQEVECKNTKLGDWVSHG